MSPRFDTLGGTGKRQGNQVADLSAQIADPLPALLDDQQPQPPEGGEGPSDRTDADTAFPGKRFPPQRQVARRAGAGEPDPA